MKSLIALLQSIINQFRYKSRLLVGLDISAASIKALVLSHENNQYRVKNYGVIPLPPNAVVENEIKDSEVVARSLELLMNSAGITVKDAAIALPDSSVITKIIQMEASLPPSEMETQIIIEAERYIPYPIDEVSLDFEVLGPSTKGPEDVDVMLVASHAVNVESRVATLKKGGLNVKVVEVESYAIERACTLLADYLPNKGVDKTIAIVDIGATMTTLTVLYNMATIFTRSEVFGGRQLTEEIQRHYGLPLAEAGLAKKQGGLPEDYATEVLQPFKDSLILYIRRALQFFFSASHQNEVDAIVLAGGTSVLPGLAALIEEQIGIKTILANPLMDMQISSNVNIAALTNDVPSLMICCGLALRSFTSQGLHLL